MRANRMNTNAAYAARSVKGAARAWIRMPGFALAGLCLAVAPPRLPAQGVRGGLPTLTSASAIHQLSLAEARRGYPVRLRAMVTYYDPYLDYPQPILVVTDRTGSVFVKLPVRSDLHLKAGQIVEVRGLSVEGGFAPDVDDPQVRVVGESRLPQTAPRKTLTRLLLGAEDASLVEMDGVIHTVQESAHDVILKIAGSDGTFTAVTPKANGVDYQHLVNEKVSIRGVACSLFNKRRQIVGVQLRFADATMLTVEAHAPALPFDLPLTPIYTLFSYSPGKPFDRLVRLRGAVTMFWPGQTICIDDGSEGLCAETSQTDAARLGQIVDVVGFPQAGNYTPTLVDASYRTATGQGQPAIPTIDPRQAMNRGYDARLVSIEGQLIGLDKGADDPSIVLSADKSIFLASLPNSSDPRELAKLKTGSRLKITGICSVQADPSGRTDRDGYKVAKSFRILLRSPDDLVVVKGPPWWNALHALDVLICALIMISGALGRMLVLRRRLQLQTELLQYQSTHDALTGLWNRKAILEFFSRECELAARSEGHVGIIMLDADHFKQVNDAYGHLAGDDVLRALSERITDSVRSTDLVGRYGGEEFLIVLPGCEMHQTTAIAERTRREVVARPVHIGDCELHVTVSIGITALEHFFPMEQDAALAAADKALYASKNGGRNRVTYLPPRSPDSSHGVERGGEAGEPSAEGVARTTKSRQPGTA